MKTKNKNRGFTLIEIMVAMVILGLVFAAAAPFFKLSYSVEKNTEKEYTIQSQVRLAAMILNKSIRNSTVTFTIPQNLFYVAGGSNVKMAGWNYLGVEDNNRIVQYTYTGTTDAGTPSEVVHHARKVLVEPTENVLYNLYFSKNVPSEGQPENSKLIAFNLECYIDGSLSKKITVQSELAAMNSLVVEDAGTPSNPATAIAYRSDPTPQPYLQPANPVDIAVTLVLDDSGSMDDNMLDPTNGTSRSKKAILKEEATKLITYFAGINGVKICIIPYGSTANPFPDNSLQYGFLEASINSDELKSQISNLNAGSDATNTGDALRRAYFALVDYNDSAENTTVNYIILLTDGNPTKYSKISSDGYVDTSTYQMTAGNSYYQNYYGNQVTTQTIGYAKYVGTQLIVNGSLDINTYLIGFTANQDDVDNALEITNSCDGEYYYAGQPATLKATFSTIAAKMLTDTWHIYGPYPE
jgi:prepilin-type N-terminal cleavage/methylation domain-containing protein